MARNGVQGALAAARGSTGAGGLTSSMVYSGEKPWHGAGVEVPAGFSCVDACDLDLRQFSDLRVQPLTLPDGKPCGFGAVVREFDGEVIGSKSVGLGFSFKGHQPRELAQLVDGLAGEAGAVVDTMGTLANGQLFWAQAAVPGLSFDVGTLQHPDQVQAKLTVMSGFTGLLASQIGSCATRIVCENTFMHALGEKKGAAYWRSVRHVKGAEGQFATIKAELEAMVVGFNAYAEAAQRLADTPVSAGVVADVLRVLVPDPAEGVNNAKAQAKRDAIALELVAGAGANLPSAQGTAWGVFQAVTAWATWGAPAASTANRWQSAILGDGAALTQQAFAVLTAL